VSYLLLTDEKGFARKLTSLVLEGAAKVNFKGSDFDEADGGARLLERPSRHEPGQGYFAAERWRMDRHSLKRREVDQ